MSKQHFVNYCRFDADTDAYRIPATPRASPISFSVFFCSCKPVVILQLKPPHSRQASVGTAQSLFNSTTCRCLNETFIGFKLTFVQELLRKLFEALDEEFEGTEQVASSFFD